MFFGKRRQSTKLGRRPIGDPGSSSTSACSFGSADIVFLSEFEAFSPLDSDFLDSGFWTDLWELRMEISGLLVGVDIWSMISCFTIVFLLLLRIFSLGLNFF